MYRNVILLYFGSTLPPLKRQCVKLFCSCAHGHTVLYFVLVRQLQTITSEARLSTTLQPCATSTTRDMPYVNYSTILYSNVMSAETVVKKIC